MTLEVASPRRELTATAIDLYQEIYPEYEGSTSQNSVKFKVKLDNTGSNLDKFIPEIESTLEDEWTVTFWQDSAKAMPWSTSSGLSIEDGELDDLWVFVEVADDADEGNYSIQISIKDEEDDSNAQDKRDAEAGPARFATGEAMMVGLKALGLDEISGPKELIDNSLDFGATKACHERNSYSSENHSFGAVEKPQIRVL